MVKVSVIIPVYNTEKYLRKCLDSVCNQTLKDIEIICVNDCSPDNCLNILREYAENDNRIKIIDFAENKGAAAARNAGIDWAQGEYLGFVDSDDFIDLDFYEKLYNKAAETGADAVKGKIKILGNEQNVAKKVFYNINGDVRKNFAYFCHSFTSAIYNINFLKTNKIYFPQNVRFFEDPYFSISALFHYKNVQVIDNTCYNYVFNNMSLTSHKTGEALCEELSVMKCLFSLVNKAALPQQNYLIVYDFLLRQVLGNFQVKNLKLIVYKKAISVMADAYASCEYKEALLEYSYIHNKELEKRYLIEQLHCNIKRGKNG